MIDAIPGSFRPVVLYGGGVVLLLILGVLAWVGITDDHPLIGWPSLFALIGFGYMWARGTAADIDMDRGEKDHGDYQWMPHDKDADAR